MQFLTLLPILVGRTILDFISTWQLWKFRVKYMDSGRDAFYTIAISLVVETVLSHIAIVVSAEEALVSFFRISIPNMLAVTDWLLISWCLASWIEQRPLYRQIFNQPESSGPTSAAANKSADLTMVGYEGEMMHQRNDLPSATQSYNQGSANFEDLSNPPRYQATTYQPNGNQGQQYLGGGRFTTRS
ncbi:hypothetical protein BJ742DRAFT_501254 [Cladochytrium replicatum]|nr:hypothetical protein BJ742DRAFT_501254 [Cladochytrium replicatum]